MNLQFILQRDLIHRIHNFIYIVKIPTFLLWYSRRIKWKIKNSFLKNYFNIIITNSHVDFLVFLEKFELQDSLHHACLKTLPNPSWMRSTAFSFLTPEMWGFKTSLKQLYTMSMDVHERYRTEEHSDVVGRFSERWEQILPTKYFGSICCQWDFVKTL
jgi:hypothetical protein